MMKSNYSILNQYDTSMYLSVCVELLFTHFSSLFPCMICFCSFFRSVVLIDLSNVKKKTHKYIEQIERDISSEDILRRKKQQHIPCCLFSILIKQ